MTTPNGIPVIDKPPVYALESETPFTTKCEFCQIKVTTYLEHKVGHCAWISCILIASFGGFLGCCLIPFCTKGTKDIVHECPECGNEFGRKCRF